MTQYTTGVISKDPDADLDYGVSWADWLALVPGDTIATSVWFVDSMDPMTAHDDSHTDTTTTVWFVGGVLHERFNVINRIATAQGRIEDVTIPFAIEEH